MYAVLAIFALTQGRDLLYPIHAVQALMSGPRVLPDYPRNTLDGAQLSDFLMGPLYFSIPALAVGMFTAWVLQRPKRRQSPEGSWMKAAAVPAVTMTAVLFVVLVLGLGFEEAPDNVQRVSTGYGVRQLGLAAWVTSHVVYAVLLVLLIGPLTRVTATLGKRRPQLSLRHK